MARREHFIDSPDTVDRSGDATDENHFKPKDGYKGSMSVVGGSLRDTFVGGRGNDWFKDSGGGSIASGNGGRDYLEGGNGLNILRGGSGDDILVGNQKDQIADRLYGGYGNDYLVAGRLKGSNRQDDGTGALTDSTLGGGPDDIGDVDAKGTVLTGGGGGRFLHPEP